MATDLAGRTALVTGASSGIGLAFARQLAARGADLVITARRAAELDQLAASLRQDHGRKVTVLPLDLTQPDAAGKLYAETEGAGVAVDVLINNAGFGTHQDFTATPWDTIARQLQLNIVTLTELSHRFASAMVGRRRGHVLNVSSVGAYTPCPGYATYAAGKAYVRNFSEALAAELAPHGVRVTCICPGPVWTEFQKVAGQHVAAWQRPVFMSAERCARIGLAALFGWRRNVVTGWSNKILMWLLRFMPRRLQVWLAGATMGRPGPA
jgi:short-subunit dehydrogenase